jgi:hypothetical protein
MQEPIEINPRATEAFRMFFVSTRWISLRPMSVLRPTLWMLGTIGRPIHGCDPPFCPNPASESCVRRIRLESRACSEPNLQPELDETPEPCVSPRHDAAKRTIGTSIREDVLRP